MLELATRHPNIVGVKDTVPNMGHTRALIQKVKAARPEFLVFSGFDEFFGHNVLSGGDGCIAGLSNFAPEVAAGYAQRARQDDLPGMAQYQRKVDSLIAVDDVAPQFVPTIKQAMALRGAGPRTLLRAAGAALHPPGNPAGPRPSPAGRPPGLIPIPRKHANKCRPGLWTALFFMCSCRGTAAPSRSGRRRSRAPGPGPPPGVAWQ